MSPQKAIYYYLLNSLPPRRNTDVNNTNVSPLEFCFENISNFL